MNGLGFYIWNLKDLLPIERTIDACKHYGVRWVAIKFQDGLSRMNQIDAAGRIIGNDSYLLQIVEKFRLAGIEVVGWGWINPMPKSTPGAQAGVTGERVQKFALDAWLIDAENYAKLLCIWYPNPLAAQSAKTYMNQLQAAGVPRRVKVMLSSYRFPSQHGGFPFAQFINHEVSGGIAPQVYWAGAHNPGAQLRQSYAEHQKIANRALPFIPIGAAFGATFNINGKATYWEPTAGDLSEFVATAKAIGCPAWGFWDLKNALARPEWMQAIAGEATPPPPPPPPDPAPETLAGRVVVTATVGVNLRLAPEAKPSTLIKALPWGTQFDVAPGIEPRDGYTPVVVWAWTKTLDEAK